MSATPHVRNITFLSYILFSSVVHATVIDYQATNLADTAVGEDLWQYTYQVSDRTFNAGEGFTIFFDRTLYASIESPPPVVNSDWDVIAWQPDLNLPDDGAYDALALVDTPSLVDVFSVSFVWLGTGMTPGAQTFAVYDGNFNTVEQGTTTRRVTTHVPEPSTVLLMLTGLFVATRRRYNDVLAFARKTTHVLAG